MAHAEMEKPTNDGDQHAMSSGEEEGELVTVALDSGTVFAYKGEPSAQDVRKLRWDLSPEQRSLANQVMTERLDEIRSMADEDSGARVKEIEELLSKG